MLRFAGNREGLAAVFSSIVVLVAIPVAVIWFSLEAATVAWLTAAVLFGGAFGELRDTWNGQRRFSPARVFFRTFEWLSLVTAGYIVLSVIGGNASPSS